MDGGARVDPSTADAASAIRLPHHDIDRTDDRRHVRQQNAVAKLAEDGEVDEAGAADLHAIRNGAALALDIEPEVAARIFVLAVDFAGRDFHRSREFGAECARWHLRRALPENAAALLHL